MKILSKKSLSFHPVRTHKNGGEMEIDTHQRHVILKHLTEELMQDQPNKQLVQEYMERVGLEYTEDPITCINSVLMALNFEEPKKRYENEKES